MHKAHLIEHTAKETSIAYAIDTKKTNSFWYCKFDKSLILKKLDPELLLHWFNLREDDNQNLKD